MACPVWASRSPVGSSAKMICGWLTRARAMATPCISSSDKVPGRWIQAMFHLHLPQQGGRPLTVLFFRHFIWEKRDRHIFLGSKRGD